MPLNNKKIIIFFILSLSLMGLIFILFPLPRRGLGEGLFSPAGVSREGTPACKQAKQDYFTPAPESPLGDSDGASCESREFKQSENSCHFAEPDDLEFYQTVYKFKKKEIDFENKKIISGVIPHHLLAADLIAEFFSNFKNQSSDYDTIILIGPNHFLAGDSDIIFSSYDWQTPYGILENDNGITSELLKNNDSIKVEEKVFEKEHSIKSETAFIKKTFPSAKFIPLVIKSGVEKKVIDSLVDSLNNIKKSKKILLLASVDFSHYKNSKTAQANDKLSIIALQNFDFDQVYNLDIDSPPSIYILLKYSRSNNAEFKLLNNSNSAILAGKPEIERTTSYATGYFVK